MKRIKAIFNAIRTLGRNPHDDVRDAWARLVVAIDSNSEPTTTQSAADFHLIEQIIFGAQDEAVAWMKKLGEQAGEGAAK